MLRMACTCGRGFFFACCLVVSLETEAELPEASSDRKRKAEDDVPASEASPAKKEAVEVEGGRPAAGPVAAVAEEASTEALVETVAEDKPMETEAVAADADAVAPATDAVETPAETPAEAEAQ